MSRVPGTFKDAPDVLRRDLSREGVLAESMLEAIGALSATRYTLGECMVMLAREPLAPGGYRWHLSISHPSRYPTWDEIKAATYGLDAIDGVVMAQVLGTGGPWVNVHENCFHLYELHDPAFAPEEAGGTTEHVPQDVLPAPASSSETRPGGLDETGPRA